MFSGKKRHAGELEPAGTWRWFAQTLQAGASTVTQSFIRKPAADTREVAQCRSPQAKRRRTSFMDATPALSPLGCGFTPGPRQQVEMNLPAPFENEDYQQGLARSSAGSFGNAVHRGSDVASASVIQVRTREDFWRAQLDAIYSRRNPLKRKNIPALMDKYKGREAVLYRKVCQQYCLCPTKFYAETSAWEGLESDGQDGSDTTAGHRFSWRGLKGMMQGAARFFGGSGSGMQGTVDGGRRTTLLLGASHENLHNLINGYGGLDDLLAQNASSSESQVSSSSSSAGGGAGTASSALGSLLSLPVAPDGSEIGRSGSNLAHRVDRPFTFSFSGGESSHSVFSKCSLDKAKEPVKWQPIWQHDLQSPEVEDGQSQDDRLQSVTFRKRRAGPEVIAGRRILKAKRNFPSEPALVDSQMTATPRFGQATSNSIYSAHLGKTPRHQYADSVATPVRANHHNSHRSA